MELVSVCPLRVASIRWRERRAGDVLTVVAKATYLLLPGTCALADEQEDPNEHDNHWDDDARRSVRAPSDLMPWKPRPEVTLVGNAFAPRGEPVHRLVVRMIIGSVDKVMVIHGERSFAHDGTLREGTRFSRMPLRWERAAGGSETTNPVGVVRAMDVRGALHLPNLEPLGASVTRPDQHIDPICFGPIAEEWPARRERLARVGGRWSSSEPISDALDPTFFMAAPADQHLDELRANERIVLENLHPEHARLVTSLPGLEPRAFVDRGMGNVSELAMTADTLWIDTDRSLCTLTFRAQMALGEKPDGRVVIAMETLGRPLAWSDVEPATRHTARPPPPVAGHDDEPMTARPPRKRSNTIPFAARPQRWPAWLPRPEGDAAPPPAVDTTATIDTPIAREEIDAAIARAAAERAAAAQPVAGPAWFRGPSSSQPDASPPASVVAPPAPVVAPPAHVIAPPVEASTPQPMVRPLSSLASPLSSLASPLSIPLSTSPPPASPPLASPPLASPTLSGTPTALKPSALRPLPSKPAPVPTRDAASRGVVAASNAAAAAAAAKDAAEPTDAKPAARPAPVRDPSRDHVDLIWFDPDAMPRIRADRDLGGRAPRRAGVVWIQGDALPREQEEARNRRDLLALLSRTPPLDEAGLARVAGDAYLEDGTFTAPLALVSGEIALAFDEVEALRATITVVSPFVGNDKKLRDAVDAATEGLKSPWPLPGDIADGFTRRLEEAFAQGQRSVAPGYLEASVEKILLQGRKYQKKTLFGEPRIRALLAFAPNSQPIPTYLPEPLAPKLPLFRRFRARAIMEVRPQEDQYESHADALLVLALARLVRRAT